MKTINVTVRDLESGEERDTVLTLNEREHHLIGHLPYVTENFEVIAVEGERLDQETGTYKREGESK